MREFKTGDRVQHKKGGPEMIVTAIDAGSRVFCEWWEGSRKRGHFDPDVLMLAPIEDDDDMAIRRGPSQPSYPV